MTKSDLSQLFDSFKGMHILVIGDVMIDSYLWGKVNRISPEAPVPIISTTGRENRLGGAANVALNIQSLGATPILCSIVGNDEAGDIFKQLLTDNHLPSEGIVASTKRKTTVKTRIISQNQHLLRVDEEESHPVESALEEKLKTHFVSLLDNYKIDAIIFEDYDKGAITPGLIQYAVKKANEKGIPTLVDPKKRNFMDYSGVTFFKPNFKEFKEGLKLELTTANQDDLLEAAKEFQASQKTDILMVTMAEKGVFIRNGVSHHFIPAEIRDIADVSGAGDTVISVSALCLAAGLPPQHVARIANMAGGLVCEHPGVVPINKKVLLEECQFKVAHS